MMFRQSSDFEKRTSTACCEDCRTDYSSRTRTESCKRVIERERIRSIFREISLRTNFGKEINIGAQKWEIVARAKFGARLQAFVVQLMSQSSRNISTSHENRVKGVVKWENGLPRFLFGRGKISRTFFSCK